MTAVMKVNKEIALDIRMSIDAKSNGIQMAVNRESPEIRFKIEKGSTPPEMYEGEYEITPILYDEIILKTGWKTMKTDMTIHPITIQEVSNPKGGITVTIGAV